MIFKIDEQIRYMEETANIPLKEGDLLMSGTPEGIAPVQEGDLLEATLSENGKILSSMQERIVREPRPSAFAV